MNISNKQQNTGCINYEVMCAVVVQVNGILWSG